MHKIAKYPLIFLAPLVLVACAGSGSSGGSTASSFSVWNALSSNSSASFVGGSSIVTLDQSITQNATGATATIGFDSGRNVSLITLNAGSGSSASFSIANGDQITSQWRAQKTNLAQ